MWLAQKVRNEEGKGETGVVHGMNGEGEVNLGDGEPNGEEQPNIKWFPPPPTPSIFNWGFWAMGTLDVWNGRRDSFPLLVGDIDGSAA